MHATGDLASETADPFSPPTGSGAVPHADGGTFKRPGALGLALQIMFALWVLLAAALTAWSLALSDFVEGLLRSPLGVDLEALNAAMGRANAIMVAELICSVVTAAVFIAWTHRVYGNLPALGAPDLPYKRGWAIGGWFVPFLNLLRPKQIIDIVWRVAHPDRGLEPAADWRLIKVSPLVHWWWGLFIVVRVLPLSFDSGATPSINGLRTEANALAGAGAVELVAAVLAFLLVTRITTNQIDRHNRLVVVESTIDRPIRHRQWGMRPVRIWLAGLAVGALVLGAVTYSTGNLDENAGDDLAARDGSGAILTRGGLLVEDLRVGDCFNDPSNLEELLAVEATPCTAPHDNEVFAILELPSDRGASYPGDDEMLADASGRCMSNIEAYVGAGFKDSGLDVFSFFPSRETWSLGDRRVVCSAFDLGWARLFETVRASGGVIPEGFASVWSLKSGDCFTETSDTLIPLVDCRVAHFGIVFDTFELESGVLPSTLDTDVDDLCLDRAATLFPARERATLDIFALRWPSPSTWVGGDREVACVALDLTAAS